MEALVAVPAKRKFKHYRGDDFRCSFRIESYVDVNDPSAGTAVRDLTGWMADVEANPDIEVILTPQPLDETGILTATILAEDLDDDQPDEVEFDIRLTDPEGFRRTYVHAVIRLQDQVA